MRFRSFVPFAAILGLAAVTVVGLGRSDSKGSAEERSDGFWSPRVASMESEHFTDLAEMTSGADAVVLGEVTAVDPGRVFVADPLIGDLGLARYITATIRVDELLSRSGDAPVDDALALEIYAVNATVMADLLKTPPSGRAIFFLRNKAVSSRELLQSPADQRMEVGFWRLVSRQGLLREVGGRTLAPVGAEEEAFLTALSDQRFDAVVDTVRALGRP